MLSSPRLNSQRNFAVFAAWKSPWLMIEAVSFLRAPEMTFFRKNVSAINWLRIVPIWMASAFNNISIYMF